MTKAKAPLIAAASKAGARFEPEAAAKATGLPVPPEELQGLLWLALIVHRAGLGLPPDPLRARGWLRFGRPLDEGEEPTAGDIGVARIEDGDVAGIVSAAGERLVTLQIAPGDGITVGTGELITARRPIEPQPSEEQETE